jgi:L-amino acid N-acyltransferase YncA
MVSIRLATEMDAAGIAHVHVRSWQTTYREILPPEYLSGLNEEERARGWREWLAGGVEAYVAVLEGKVVGFISGGAIREPLESYDAELYIIYLLEEAQGMGTGSALLRRLAASLRGKGFGSMIVWVLERNSATQFYGKSGARLVMQKEVEIGGVALSDLALGWADLAAIESPD